MAIRTLLAYELAFLLSELRVGLGVQRAGVRALVCRGDLSTTAHILRSMGKSSAEILWILDELRENGGCCDCEVLLNVDPREADG